MIGRLLSCLAMTAALAVAPAQSAPAAVPPAHPKAEGTGRPDVSPSREAEFKAVRERDVARQLQWDRKMKALSGSICTGC